MSNVFYCENCGEKLFEDSVFCSECGAKVKPFIEAKEVIEGIVHDLSVNKMIVEANKSAAFDDWEEELTLSPTDEGKKEVIMEATFERHTTVADESAIFQEGAVIISEEPIVANEISGESTLEEKSEKVDDKEEIKLIRKHKQKWFFGIVITAIVAAVILLLALPARHSWEDADCDTPKTCSKCGETEGAALGHSEGEWKVVETDMVLADEISKKYCLVCNKELDRKRQDIDTLHDTYHFLMTPDEFVERMDNMLATLDGCTITAKSGSQDGDFACGILNEKTSATEGMFLFVGDGEQISKYQDDDVCFDGGMGRVSDGDNLAYVLLALIQTCDPSLSFSEAKEVGSKVLDDYGEFVEKNGINYFVTLLDPDYYLIGFSCS